MNPSATRTQRSVKRRRAEEQKNNDTMETSGAVDITDTVEQDEEPPIKLSVGTATRLRRRKKVAEIQGE